MGIFDRFKKKTNYPAENASDKMLDLYDNFYTKLASNIANLSESNDKETVLGNKITEIATFDFVNFNALLYNKQMNTKEKFIFLIEQATLYILYIDRHFFSKYGAQKRDDLMENVENGYYNGIINLSSGNEKFVDFARSVQIKREKETGHIQTIENLLDFYCSKCLLNVGGFEEDYPINKMILINIVTASIPTFHLKILPFY